MVLKGKALGKEGERQAGLYLEKQGLVIIERNFRTRSGEIDLVVRDKKELVFVEVKTRSGTDFGTALEAVHSRKCRQIVRVASEYLLQNDGFDQPVRFDVIGILLGDNPQFEHIKNAFDAS
ncbi:MAG: YraN family protein [Thermodesulfobacteriota bacterium]